jgi:RHS repeat-associated protein
MLCQARNASNVAIRSYYKEGEFVLGSPNQPYFYGLDQLGSVKRAFATTSSAPAYSYDPYGVPLQLTAPVTDFVYAGMFYNADSGLYLTTYRAFDPVSGRWLSRDPIGERADPTANLYPYVRSNPTNLTDPEGLQVAVPGPLPFPLPPVFIPGTPQNQEFTRQTMGALKAIGNAIFNKPPVESSQSMPRGVQDPLISQDLDAKTFTMKTFTILRAKLELVLRIGSELRRTAT